MQLKCQVPSLELHVPGPQDQAGWRGGPSDAPGHAAWLFLPASCHGMLRVAAGPPSGRHRKARPPCRLSGVCSLAVHSRIPASAYLRSCPCLIAGVPVFTSLDLSKDRLLLSFGAHSEQQVANTAGRSPRSPPAPYPGEGVNYVTGELGKVTWADSTQVLRVLSQSRPRGREASAAAILGA